MKRIIRFFDVFVFIATTLAIAGVFYEGMESEMQYIILEGRKANENADIRNR